MRGKGSTWGKWDFHVHTPYSILNNMFGFNPFDPKDNYHEEEFDNYVTTLFSKAIENEIVAIGITDYFMVEGYKRIRQKYLDSPEKMEKLFPNKDDRDKINNIYVFPNIEFRINNFIGEKAHSVNYHVILSGDLSVRVIEENFLHSIQFEFGDGTSRPLTIDNIIAFGESTIKTKGSKGSPLLIGLENITVSSEEIIKILGISDLSKKYLISIPVDEDMSEVSWSGRDYTTRRKLYHQADCYMSSNPGTRKWALAKGEEQRRIEEIGSIKPCIWGSDAHSYDKMFNPDEERHCWIKSQPTFEGLIQILYEPATRVFIQKERPFSKDSHQLIQSITFNNKDFPINPIELNDSLVCIIGGKSTGKSLLLRNIAYAINSTYAKSQEIIVGTLKPIDEKNASVIWRDGTTEERKIVYIPQTFLNRTIEDPETKTAIDDIIADVLHQEPAIKKAYDELQDSLAKIKGDLVAHIILYDNTSKNLSEISNLLSQDGRSASFIATISDLEIKRSDLADKVDITQEDIKKYLKIKEVIENLKIQKDGYVRDNDLIDQLQTPIILFRELDEFYCSGELIQIGNELKERTQLIKYLEGFVTNKNIDIAKGWENEKNKFIENNKAAILELEKQLNDLIPEFELLKQKVEQNENLRKISEKIEAEKTKLQIAKFREKKESELYGELEKLKVEINKVHEKYHQAYSKYCKVVNEKGISKRTELSFSAETNWKKKAFTDFIYDSFDNRSFNSFYLAYNYNFNNLTEEVYGNNLLLDIWNSLLGQSKTVELRLKASHSLNTALQSLFGDWYNVHYTVKSGNDTIADMSPGKKALALLELLINLEDTKCPILIDQPEDDLDNRSIYNQLVKFIKIKKCERQMIIVTHNANIVLGADAEQVIVANQSGKDTPNNDCLRFEYRSGAIEDDYCDTNDDGDKRAGILSQKGIQTQICDILEGGKPALELRRNKYTSNNKLSE